MFLILYLPIFLPITIIAYLLTPFKKRKERYIPSLVFYILYIIILIVAFSSIGENGMIFILPTMISNVIGLILFIIAFLRDYRDKH